MNGKKRKEDNKIGARTGGCKEEMKVAKRRGRQKEKRKEVGNRPHKDARALLPCMFPLRAGTKFSVKQLTHNTDVFVC